MSMPAASNSRVLGLMPVIPGAALLAAMFSNSVVGAPIQLNCVETDPPSSKRITLNVDIENKRVMFGDSTYDIVHMIDRYITAVDRKMRESQVGAEVLVLNRITGDLKRASVFVPVVWHTSGESVARTFVAECSD